MIDRPRLTRPGAVLRRRWRRSLRLRLVVTTLGASAVVVLLIGTVLVRMIALGLLTAQREAAVTETSAGLRYAHAQLAALGGADDPAVQDTVANIVRALGARGGGGSLYDVVLQPSSGELEAAVDREVALSIPADLRALVSQGNEAYAYAREPVNHGGTGPALVVGEPVSTSAGFFELYYIFPLQNQAQTISLVRGTLLAGGGALLILLAGVAVLVARQVASPVRLAARTAERLAAGLLDERMRVRGEDELARLAASFNHMAASLQRQIAQLEELSRLQQRFTSDVSHELRTPLTTVRMAADVLYAARGEFPPEVARTAELLHHEVGRFEMLLADLLEISRYDAGGAVLEAEPVDVRVLVGHVVDIFRPIADEAGSALVLRTPDTPVVAEVDQRRVERILRNLVGNAIEHGDGRPVEITLASADDALAVTVRDHGVGLAPNEVGQVFSRFWRADPSRTRRSGGSGLGLSISVEDARLHDGWLQAWGEPGRGAQFRLTLPLRAGTRLGGSPLPLEPAAPPVPTPVPDSPGRAGG